MLPSRQPSTPHAGVPAVPTPLTPLVDRAAELARLEDWLARPDIRLVTLTGPAGAGKTRLAIEVGLRPGARFVDVAACDDPQAALRVVHEALDTPDLEPGDADVGDLLLLLDNFEHVLSIAPRVVES